MPATTAEPEEPTPRRRRPRTLLLAPLALLAAGCVDVESAWRAHPDGRVDLRAEMTVHDDFLDIAAMESPEAANPREACESILADALEAEALLDGGWVRLLDGDSCTAEIAYSGDWSEFAEIAGAEPPVRPVASGWEFVTEFDVDSLEPESTSPLDGIAQPGKLAYAVTLPGRPAGHNAHAVAYEDGESVFTWAWHTDDEPNVSLAESGSRAEALYASGLMYAATRFEHPPTISPVSTVQLPAAPLDGFDDSNAAAPPPLDDGTTVGQSAAGDPLADGEPAEPARSPGSDSGGERRILISLLVGALTGAAACWGLVRRRHGGKPSGNTGSGATSGSGIAAG